MRKKKRKRKALTCFVNRRINKPKIEGGNEKVEKTVMFLEFINWGRESI